MNINECESKIKILEDRISILSPSDIETKNKLLNEIVSLREEAYSTLSAWDRVQIARNTKRPKAIDYINMLFDDFIELHGDYYFADDASIISGIASFKGTPVTVLAQAKGKNVEDNIKRNFGSTNPEGFRKTLRLAKQAEKFKRPIITIVDTSGAYPGKGAEERGQARAIAENIMEFSKLNVPVIALVIGEGGSGGALALSVANRIVMLENAVYSILSPEGFASILFKDSSRTIEAASMMKLTSYDLKDEGVVDYIVKEPLGGAQNDFKMVIDDISAYIKKALDDYSSMSLEDMLDERYKKFRVIGTRVNE